MTSNLPTGRPAAHHAALRLNEGRMRQALRSCALSAQAAEEYAALLADEIRQDVETRLDIGPTDPAAWDDPGYAAALDVLARIGRLRRTAVIETTAATEARHEEDRR